MSNEDNAVGRSGVAGSAKAGADAVDNLNRALGDFFASGARGSGQIKEVTGAFDALNRVIEQNNNTVQKLLGLGSNLIGKIPILGPPGEAALNGLNKIAGAFGNLAKTIGVESQKVITSLDSQTRGLRDYENDLFTLEKRFGGTIEESQKFADAIRSTSGDEFATSLRMTGTEMGRFVRATSATSLRQKQLNQVVQTGYGAVELYGAATAFAASTSMEFSTAAALLNTLMNKQGKSAQEATNMFGMYAGVAKEAGLAVDDVAKNLNGAVSGFAKIGMAADFGKPILEGFARTMKDMGLGIEESLGLTTSLTSALAGLTNNYGMAYLTFQRGGLDIGGGGGGGVLGSSIALQSAYLEAEKTGDQAAISDQLVRGMRDTLASFTGGDIVTVQEANEDPAMQNQFYVQQQMLKSAYGISDDNTASRILDMLSQLDEATRTGDSEAQKNLRDQIQKEVQGRDKTLDEMEKVNRHLETQINLMIIRNRDDINQTRRAARGAGGLVDQYVSSAGMSLVEAEIKAAAKLITGGEEVLDSAVQGFQRLMGEREAAHTRGGAQGVRDAVHAGALPNLAQDMDQTKANVTYDALMANKKIDKETLEQLIGSRISSGQSLSEDNLKVVLNHLLNKATSDDSNTNRPGMEQAILKALESSLGTINIKVEPTPGLDKAIKVSETVIQAAKGP